MKFSVADLSRVHGIEWAWGNSMHALGREMHT